MEIRLAPPIEPGDFCPDHGSPESPYPCPISYDDNGDDAEVTCIHFSRFLDRQIEKASAGHYTQLTKDADGTRTSWDFRDGLPAHGPRPFTLDDVPGGSSLKDPDA